MKKWGILILIVIVVFLVSCNNSLISDVTASNDNISFVYDKENDVVVLNNNETLVSIESFDEEEYSVSRCIEIYDYKLIESDFIPRAGIDADGLKAVIIGLRNDGTPGIWLIDRNMSVSVPVSDESGKHTSRLREACPESGDIIGEEFRGLMGWNYFPTMLSEDGLVIGGYALNSDGFNKIFINIDAGSKIAVYWNLYTDQLNQYHIGWANVVGTFRDIPQSEAGNRFIDFILKWISRLKLLFIDYLDNYLKEPDSIELSGVQGEYLMYGKDKNDVDSVALFNRKDIISISPLQIDDETPYAVIGPEGTLNIPVFQTLSIDLELELTDNWNDPVNDGVVFHYEMVSTDAPDIYRDRIVTSLSDTGSFQINWNGYLQGNEVVFKFWTEVPGYSEAQEFYITFFYEVIS